MSFKEYLNEGEHTLSAAMRRRDKKYDSAVKKAKAWMKKLNKSSEDAAKEFEVKVEDLNENLNEEVTDLEIVKKVAKRAFGKDFDKVTQQDEKTYIIGLKGTEVRWNDLKVLEINTNSGFRMGDINKVGNNFTVEIYSK